MIEKFGTNITRLAAALAVPVFIVGSAAFAASTVNMKQGRFVSAREKNAVKAFRMKQGYTGDADARALADKIFRLKGRPETLNLKDDGAGHLVHVSSVDPSAHFR